MTSMRCKIQNTLENETLQPPPPSVQDTEFGPLADTAKDEVRRMKYKSTFSAFFCTYTLSLIAIDIDITIAGVYTPIMLEDIAHIYRMYFTWS